MLQRIITVKHIKNIKLCFTFDNSPTKNLSSLRTIVTILLSWVSFSWVILLMLMSVISLKSQKVCHCQEQKGCYGCAKFNCVTDNTVQCCHLKVPVKVCHSELALLVQQAQPTWRVSIWLL